MSKGYKVVHIKDTNVSKLYPVVEIIQSCLQCYHLAGEADCLDNGLTIEDFTEIHPQCKLPDAIITMESITRSVAHDGLELTIEHRELTGKIYTISWEEEIKH